MLTDFARCHRCAIFLAHLWECVCGCGAAQAEKKAAQCACALIILCVKYGKLWQYLRPFCHCTKADTFRYSLFGLLLQLPRIEYCGWHQAKTRKSKQSTSLLLLGLKFIFRLGMLKPWLKIWPAVWLVVVIYALNLGSALLTFHYRQNKDLWNFTILQMFYKRLSPAFEFPASKKLYKKLKGNSTIYFGKFYMPLGSTRTVFFGKNIFMGTHRKIVSSWHASKILVICAPSGKLSKLQHQNNKVKCSVRNGTIFQQLRDDRDCFACGK